TSAVSIQELETRLQQFKAADPELPVVVKGDASIQYFRVIEVLDVTKRLQIHQLGLATERIVK
ncbi:MAG: biopolymer transporter ExbD, partial [Desulfobacterales bacterium]|nr:biopolymer transporter ExbD [Desulfobacterales bacterium]